MNKFSNRVDAVLESLLLEGASINQAVSTLTSKKSRWKNRETNPIDVKEWVRDVLLMFDPSGQKGKYLRYIAKQVALGSHNAIMRIGHEEDGQRIRDTIAWFDDESKRGSWGAIVARYYKEAAEMDEVAAAKRFSNIFNFKSWRHIENIQDKTERARRSGGGEDAEAEEQEFEGAILVYELEVGPDHFKAFKIMEPEALCELGMGSNWCTSWDRSTEIEPENPSVHWREPKQWEVVYPSWHPKAGSKRPINIVQGRMPSSYIMTYFKDEHYIILRSEHGAAFEPYWQFGGRFFMHRIDQPMRRISINEDYFLGKWAEESEAPIELILKQRRKWAPNPELDERMQQRIRNKYADIRPPLLGVDDDA